MGAPDLPTRRPPQFTSICTGDPEQLPSGGHELSEPDALPGKNDAPVPVDRDELSGRQLIGREMIIASRCSGGPTRPPRLPGATSSSTRTRSVTDRSGSVMK